MWRRGKNEHITGEMVSGQTLEARSVDEIRGIKPGGKSGG